MTPRRFPPAWSVEEQPACFLVRDHSGQALAYVYFEDEPGRRSTEEVSDEVFAFQTGADDFIRKPFSQRLLVERVKAVLRRASPKDGTLPKRITNILERGALRMDMECHTCTWKNKRVTLTVSEFVILHALASRPGVVKGRDALMELAYDSLTDVDQRNIDSHIKRLRRKFKASDSKFDSVQTLYGVGYCFKEI